MKTPNLAVLFFCTTAAFVVTDLIATFSPINRNDGKPFLYAEKLTSIDDIPSNEMCSIAHEFEEYISRPGIDMRTTNSARAIFHLRLRASGVHSYFSGFVYMHTSVMNEQVEKLIQQQFLATIQKTHWIREDRDPADAEIKRWYSEIIGYGIDFCKPISWWEKPVSSSL